jgi:fatty acid desaturase
MGAGRYLAHLSCRAKFAHMDAIDHRTVITNLDSALREFLVERSNAPGLLRFGFHLGTILILGTLIALGVPFWFALLPAQGILIVFLFTTMHECIHETAFKSSFLNTVVSTMSSFLIFVPPTWFRFFHFAHHRHTHDPVRDPELKTPKPSTLIGYIKHVSGIPLWNATLRTLVSNAMGRNADDFVPPKAKARVTFEARAMLAIYVLLAGASVVWDSSLLIWTWIVPLLLGQPFLRLFLLAEHTECPHVENMFENTRTTFTTKLVRLVAWNMPFHAEHHALPTVPFHKLPELHEAVRHHLMTTADGYARFNGQLVSRYSSRKS